MALRKAVMDCAALVAVGCLVVLVALRVRAEFAPGNASAGSPAEAAFVTEWRALTRPGHIRGNPNAQAVLITFIDFECPACRTFALGAERAIRRKYGGEVSFVVRHLPLPYHRLAFPAAKAAECAAAQGRFHEIYDLFFEKQDSLGLKAFSSFAHESGVADLEAFDRCMATDSADARIRADIAAARSAGARGTPTVIVNGLRLAQPPDSAELDRLLRSVLRDGAGTS